MPPKNGAGLGTTSACELHHAQSAAQPDKLLTRLPERQSCLLPASQSGIEEVAEGVAEHVEAEHRGAQGHPWPDG